MTDFGGLLTAPFEVLAPAVSPDVVTNFLMSPALLAVTKRKI
jgi:hypothetical protein